MNRVSSTQKGLITGTLMVVCSLLAYQFRNTTGNNLQFAAYIIYGAGIVWTLNSFAKTQDTSTRFIKYFTEGFKCFIVVSFLMVLFTIIFLKAHPEFREQMAAGYKAELEKQGNNTPQEIEKLVESGKSYFTVMHTSIAIFRYLVIGALVTVVSGFAVYQLKKNKMA
ncbi:MAG: DUF4199 family protein [Ferruginibacter sp.]